MERNTTSYGSVRGRYGKEFLLCSIRSRFYSLGCIWFGCNPYSHGFPVIITQILLFILGYRIFYFCLKRFGQSTLNCQILAGLVLGKSFFLKLELYKKIFFPRVGRMPLETVAEFGFIIHLFVIGINIDPGVVKKMGKDAVAVGVASFLTPFVLCIASVIFFIPRDMLIPPNDNDGGGISKFSLVFIIMALSMTSFAGTSKLLSDLQILNSDIGRLATLASMVNDTCNYLFFASMSVITASKKQQKLITLLSILWHSVLFFVLVYGIRPLMIRLAKSLPESGEGGGQQHHQQHQSLKEIHFLAIMIMAFVFSFLLNTGGMPMGVGFLLFGTVIPEGPPLGSALVNKVDSLATGLFLPSKFALAGFSVNVFEFEANPAELVFLLLIIFGYCAKFLGVLVTGVFFKISISESFALGLIMCCRGVVEASIYMALRASSRISVQAFDTMILAMIIVNGIAQPLILQLYDPWSKYAGKQIYSILQSDQRQLRTLVCIHMEDNVQPIIDLLSSSNPTNESPLLVSVLNLMELRGRLSAVLEPNLYKGKITSMLNRTHHMANAFDYFVSKCHGSVIVNHFTSIAPYATMHSDICTIAMDVRAQVIILPFHKQKQIDGSYQSNLPILKTVNQNVFRNAPSTVALLIDRSQTAGAQQPVIGRINNYRRIFVLFLGGVDDREALGLATRMIGRPKLINLTLVWLRHVDHSRYQENDDHLDDVVSVRRFRADSVSDDRVCYREELAKDAVGTTRVLRSFEGNCDLCIIGRYHASDSPLTQGILNEWSDCPELGAIGDILGNADFSYSVLVVKQHKMEDPKYSKRRSFTFGV